MTAKIIDFTTARNKEAERRAKTVKMALDILKNLAVERSGPKIDNPYQGERSDYAAYAFESLIRAEYALQGFKTFIPTFNQWIENKQNPQGSFIYNHKEPED